MDKPIKLFTKTTGLNSKQDPAELLVDLTTGLTELSEAVNVDITDRGKIKRRGGFERLDNNAWHSIAGFGLNGLGVVGDSLYIINADGSSVGIRSGLSIGAKVSYQKVIGSIFYCNGQDNGVVIENISWPWLSSTEPTTPGVVHDMRYLTAPPVGDLVSYLSGRVYLAKGNILFHSLPWAYYWFNLGEDFIPFNSTINMLCPTNAGMFVGTETSTVFVRGLNPSEAQVIDISDSAPVKWTNVEVDPRRFPPDLRLQGKTWVWTSKEGICVGSGDGTFYNLTLDRLDIEFALEGAGLFDGSKYIGLLNP